VDSLREKTLVTTSLKDLPATPTELKAAAGVALDITANFTCPTSTAAGGGAAGNCSAGLRARVSKDAKDFVEVSFSCPAADRSADCQVAISAVGADPPDISSSSSGNASVAAGATAAATRLDAASRGAGSFAVPFSTSAPFDGTFSLRVLLDTCVLEVYAGDTKLQGRAIDTMMYLPADPTSDGVAVLGLSEGVDVALEVHSMGSAFA
jgi:hypothetical protein